MLKQLATSALDQIDHRLCTKGIVKGASFGDLAARAPRALYAGRLSRSLAQFAANYIGMTPYFRSSRNIDFDVTSPLPLPDDYIDLYQSEDVFEHIPYEQLLAVFDEIHRVLKPGGLFRLSLPDYRFDQYERRSLKDERGEIIFDPGGGGEYRHGQVTGGGHLWFPTYEKVRALFESSRFHHGGHVEFLHYTTADGGYVMNEIDHSVGEIQRVPGRDVRVENAPRPISIVVDAHKLRG